LDGESDRATVHRWTRLCIVVHYAEGELAAWQRVGRRAHVKGAQEADDHLGQTSNISCGPQRFFARPMYTPPLPLRDRAYQLLRRAIPTARRPHPMVALAVGRCCRCCRCCRCHQPLLPPSGSAYTPHTLTPQLRERKQTQLTYLDPTACGHTLLSTQNAWSATGAPLWRIQVIQGAFARPARTEPVPTWPHARSRRAHAASDLTASQSQP
jgi:hypothetical protein